MSRQSWKVTFDRGDSFRDRARAHQGSARPAVPPAWPGPVKNPAGPPAPPAPARRPESVPSRSPRATYEDGRRDCSRGAWCEEREPVIENGTRSVVPARTYRAFCTGCEGHIGKCLDDPENGLLKLYGRLAAEIGEARQSEVMVKTPFGPEVPLSEAIDAHMRSMGETLCSWEERCRDIDNLSALGDVARRPQDSADDIGRSVGIIAPRLSILLSLVPMEMLRVMPWWAVPEDADILTGDGFMVKAIVNLDGEDAGRDVMHLHYFARRLLLETNPPMPLLPDFRCRACEFKSLRRAAPPWHADSVWYWSRCDNCGDEMTRDDYDTNAKRWLAYEKAHLATAMLGPVTQVA